MVVSFVFLNVYLFFLSIIRGHASFNWQMHVILDICAPPTLLCGNTRYHERLQRCLNSTLMQSSNMFWGTSRHLNVGITWNVHGVKIACWILTGRQLPVKEFNSDINVHPYTPLKSPGEMNNETRFSATLLLKWQNLFEASLFFLVCLPNARRWMATMWLPGTIDPSHWWC